MTLGLSDDSSALTPSLLHLSQMSNQGRELLQPFVTFTPSDILEIAIEYGQITQDHGSPMCRLLAERLRTSGMQSR